MIYHITLQAFPSHLYLREGWKFTKHVLDLREISMTDMTTCKSIIVLSVKERHYRILLNFFLIYRQILNLSKRKTWLLTHYFSFDQGCEMMIGP